MLSCESGCNDGVSFPFLYIGLYAVIESSAGLAFKDWVLLTLLWQCLLGTFLGLLIGYTANRLLRFSENRHYITGGSFFVFYFLLAIFAIGVGSTLGADDFLVAFGAGTGFAWDGCKLPFRASHLPMITNTDPPFVNHDSKLLIILHQGSLPKPTPPNSPRSLIFSSILPCLSTSGP